MKLVILGNARPGHVGRSLADAARAARMDVTLIDTTAAFAGNAVARRLAWHLRGKMPLRLAAFSRSVVQYCERERPDVVLTTGTAPVDAVALARLRCTTASLANLSTDDPWNPTHQAPWFLEALQHYEHVFTPRHSNEPQLRAHGVQYVTYLPFGYDPTLWYAEEPSPAPAPELGCDVLFVGGADADRVPYVRALLRAGLRVATYGGYWTRYAGVRRAARGLADTATIREATYAAKISLCLVRRANRDGHVMRSYELPAMKACILAEDTPDHRRMYGPDGTAARLFSTPDEMAEMALKLTSDDEQRHTLAAAAHARLATAANTYASRLQTLLQAISG